MVALRSLRKVVMRIHPLASVSLAIFDKCDIISVSHWIKRRSRIILRSAARDALFTVMSDVCSYHRTILAYRQYRVTLLRSRVRMAAEAFFLATGFF